jgi:putative transferase (TIGR04331 family)
MAENKNKLLVLTALESTWGEQESILFLGEWCKLYERRHVWGSRNHEVSSFHWDDRDKLSCDYEYLKSLHHMLLKHLAESLNQLHQTNHSTRYWQILLDPWLYSYVSVLFDRWENLRLLFEQNKVVEAIFVNEKNLHCPSFSFIEFQSQSLSDEWNQLLLQRVIAYNYLDRCVVHKEAVEINKSALKKNTAVVVGKESLRHRLATFVDSLLGRYFTNYDVVFSCAYFNKIPLIKLNLDIGQIPRLFLNEFKLTDSLFNSFPSIVDRSLRDRLTINFDPQSRFEEFLKASILQDLPVSVVESYAAMRQHVNSLPIKTKVIITANDHCNNVLFQFWSAEEVNKGTKLVILEHGGSLPAKHWWFNFEEDISDVVGTWFLPFHEKQIQVPPSKLVDQYKKNRVLAKDILTRKYCSVIGNEFGRWVYRCHSSPMSAQCLKSFNQTIDLYNMLDDKIQQSFLVKPNKVSEGPDTAKRYEDILGENRIFSKPLSQIYNISRVIICTYPQTTFSEAMMSDAPTILLYVREYQERHSITEPLLDCLQDAKILFYDAKAASTHINEIWACPTDWWDSPRVRSARDQFKNTALSFDKDWRKEWNHFINTVVEQPGSNVRATISDA